MPTNDTSPKVTRTALISPALRSSTSGISTTTAVFNADRVTATDVSRRARTLSLAFPEPPSEASISAYVYSASDSVEWQCPAWQFVYGAGGFSGSHVIPSPDALAEIYAISVMRNATADTVTATPSPVK